MIINCIYTGFDLAELQTEVFLSACHCRPPPPPSAFVLAMSATPTPAPQLTSSRTEHKCSFSIPRLTAQTDSGEF